MYSRMYNYLLNYIFKDINFRHRNLNNCLFLRYVLHIYADILTHIQMSNIVTTIRQIFFVWSCFKIIIY